MYANKEVKFMIKRKVLVLTGFLCFLTGFSQLAFSQAAPILRMKNSGDVGFVPTQTRNVTPNLTNDVTVTNVTLSSENVLGTLGCGALDTHQGRIAVLNTDDSDLNAYFNTNVSNFMVATLFNSPAVAQIFNGLENYSGSRVRELQDRCAAMEYKDDKAPAQWQAVQNCIQSYQEQMNATGPITTAEAFKFCLSSPDYMEQTGETLDKSLYEATVEVLESPKWNGTLHSALQRTRMCLNTTAGPDCSLLALLPNVRWCMHSNTAGLGECGDGNDTASFETGITGSGDVTISPEAVSPIQIFDWAFGLSEGFTNYASVYAETLVDLTGLDLAMTIAERGENISKTHVDSYATAAQVMNGYTEAGAESGIMQSAPSNLEGVFANYLNCSRGTEGVDNVLQWENFNNTVADAVTATLLPPPLIDIMVYGTDMPAAFLTSVNSDQTVSNVNVPGTYNLVEAGLKCALKYDLRLSLADYIALTNDDHSFNSDGALLGYRTQLAYAVTRNVLEFLTERLRLAQLDLGMISVTDRNAPPPFVRNTLDTLIEGFNDKLQNFERKRQQQKDYAKIIANIYETNYSGVR